MAMASILLANLGEKLGGLLGHLHGKTVKSATNQ